MEEVVKYQSLQDRIKRLTNNKKNGTQIKIQQKQSLRFNQISNPEENRKQYNRSYLLTNRKGSEIELTKYISPQQSKPESIRNSLISSRNSEMTSNQKFRFLEIQDREIKPLLRKSSEQYLSFRASGHQKQNSKFYGEMDAKSRKSDTPDLSCLLSQKYANPNQMGERQKIFVRSGKNQTTARKTNSSHNKNESQTNFTKRDNTIKFQFQEIKDLKWDSYPELKKNSQSTKVDADSQFTGRTLKRCLSSLVQRIPGKIVKNR